MNSTRAHAKDIYIEIAAHALVVSSDAKLLFSISISNIASSVAVMRKYADRSSINADIGT